MKLILVAWCVLVVSISIASAQETIVQVPEGCSLKAEDMQPITETLCDHDLGCVERIVQLVCPS